MSSKGFKPDPHISRGEAVRLERICDAVLSGDVDAPQRFIAWTNRITQKLGGEKQWSRWFVHHANDDLGYAIASKFHDAMHSLLPPDVQKELSSKSKECLTSMLQDDGLVLGKDFSMGPDGGFVLGDKAIQQLKADMPQEAWAEWESQGLIKSVTSCPWQAVEKRLEVAFRENLLTRLTELVEQGRSAAVVGGWVVTVSGAVSNQVMGNDEDLTLFGWMSAHIREKHTAVYDAVLAAIKSGEFVESDELLGMDINCLCDVAIAAGSSEENGELKSHGISREGLQRLSLVWRGDRLGVTEVIAMLDRNTRGKAA